MVSFSCYRVCRGLRSMCTPILTVVGFSLILTYMLVLYQPTRGPGIKQRMGWQSWEVIDAPITMTSGNASSPPSSPSKPSEGVDWWNVSTPDEKVDLSSLPLDVWSPLLPHDTGLSEIAITQCFMDPAMVVGMCEPHSTSEQDATKGRWVRIPRNLNMEATIFSGWLSIYYRRTRRQDINLIANISLLPESEMLDPSEGWNKVNLSLRSGVRGISPLFLWYKIGKTAGEMSASEKASIITELDVLFGQDIPWYGFEKLNPPTLPANNKFDATWLTYRRGVKVPPKAQPLHFSHAGKFKILQVADLHYSVSQGICRDTLLDPCEHSDNLTNGLISHVLDLERPDLVVFSGDQLNGQGTSWDARSILAKFSRAVADKGIPWAAVFGNHDQEDGVSKEQQMAFMKGLPYSMVERGPKDIHGVGNYVLKVHSADASKTQLLTLYFLDSGDYVGRLNWLGFYLPTAFEYDWIRQSQIDWFLQESASINPIQRPFTPDTGKDFGSLWTRQKQVTPNVLKLAKPNALMFFHIPLPQSHTSKADINSLTSKPLDVGLSGLEGDGNAKKSEGFFEKGVLKAMESANVANKAHEVKVIGNGHCHVTENCRRVHGVWLCFGGGGSYSGYGKIGFDRRFRIYDISDFGETIRTYKRTEKDEILDEMVLAGPGSPPLS